jgi:hypothetical protein
MTKFNKTSWLALILWFICCLAIVAIVPSTRQAILGVLANKLPLLDAHNQLPLSMIPHGAGSKLDAATLAGHPGLYFLDAGNLTGVLSTDHFSAYQDLAAEGKIAVDSTLITDHNFPVGNPGTITGIATGLGLTGGGTGGAVTIKLVPGIGIAMVNGAVTASLGNTVDLNSSEVVNVLPLASGGTGLSTLPGAGRILVGDGTGYTLMNLTAGDGITLTNSSQALTYALDGTVCRISGNCTSLGIIGSGTTNYLPKFASSGAIGNSLVFDNGTNVGIGTTSPEQRLNLSGGTFQIGLSANPYYTSITENALQFNRAGQPSYIDQVGIGGSLRFRMSNTASYDTAGLTILSNGNVGLGTTTPGYALDIYGTSPRIRFQGSGVNQTLGESFYESDGTLRGRLLYAGGNSSGNRYVGLLNDNADSIVFDSITATPIIFYTTNSERLRILAGGNIGVGTIIPQSKLDINGGVAIGAYAGVTAAPSNGLIISGNTGIGQSSPTVALHVGPGAAMLWSGLSLGYAGGTPQIYASQTSGEAGIGVGVNDGSRNSRAKLFVDDTNSVWGLSLTWSSSGQKPFIISSANTEQLRLDTSGRLGLGTNNPAHKLELASATTAAGGIGFGTDTELYRSAANSLSLSSGNFLSIATTNVNTATGFQIGSTITPATVASNAIGGTDETFDQPFEAVTFNSGSATTMGSVLVQLKKDAGVTDTSSISARLYSDNAGQPGSQAIAVQTSVYAQTLSSVSYTNVEWFLNGVISANTNYWIVFSKNISGGSIYFNSTVGVSQHAYSPDLTTWTLENKRLLFTVKGKSYVASYGNSTNYIGVEGLSTNYLGVYGQSTNNIGIEGVSTNSIGMEGFSTNSYGTYGVSTNSIGAFGQSTNNIGTRGSSTNSWGLYGASLNSFGGIIEISGAATANNSNNTLLVRRTTSGSFNVTGDLFMVQDNTTTLGTVSGNLLKLQKGAVGVFLVGNTGLTTIQPSVDATGALMVKNAAGTITALQVDTSTGRVGIGTGSPTALLHLKGTLTTALSGTISVANGSPAVLGTSTSFTSQINIGDAISIAGVAYTVLSITDNLNLTLTNNYAGTTASGIIATKDPNLLTVDNGAGTNKLTVDKRGFVGVGTNAPSLLNGTVNTLLDIEGPNTAGIAIRSSAGSGKQFLVYTDTLGNLIFYDASAGSARAAINTSGYLGLGVSSNINSRLTLASDTTAVGGILFGTDTNLYRAAAGSLKTDTLFTAGSGVVIGSSGAQISRFLSATTTWDPPSIATGAATTTTITVTNSALGDTASASFSLALPDNVTIAASVSAANTIKVTITNLSGGTVDLASGTLRADAWQH